MLLLETLCQHLLDRGNFFGSVNPLQNVFLKVKPLIKTEKKIHGRLRWSVKSIGANKEKGVFSLQRIPAGTRICLYVGEIHDKPPKEGKFIMEVNPDMYVDAEHHPVDVGYIYYLDKDVDKHA